jgi:hypothetical protein
MDTIEELLVAERLGEVVDRPGRHRLGACAIVGEGRDEDDRWPLSIIWQSFGFFCQR